MMINTTCMSDCTEIYRNLKNGTCLKMLSNKGNSERFNIRLIELRIFMAMLQCTQARFNSFSSTLALYLDIFFCVCVVLGSHD